MPSIFETRADDAQFEISTGAHPGDGSGNAPALALTHEVSEPARPASSFIRPLDRTELVNRIAQINPGASRSFLDSFDDQALKHYLARLHLASRPREALWGAPVQAAPDNATKRRAS